MIRQEKDDEKAVSAVCVQWYCVYQQVGKKLLETLDAQEV